MDRLLLLPAIALFCASCAVSPEQLERREVIDAQIEAILSAPLADGEAGEIQRCLSRQQYRSFRALDERHILFEGRRDRLWVNTLRTRCPDLRHATVLVTTSFSTGRLCDADRFTAADWFSWPWYRRWPWSWGRGWGTGMPCSLGTFRPVTAEEVDAIEALIREK